MRGSSHIISVLIGVKYRNFCQTLDDYLCFYVRQFQTKLCNGLVINRLHGL